jgi:hypothetical protein
MAFTIKKNPKKIMICATGSGWQLAPKNSEKTIYVLNDYVHKEKYGINPDKLFIMDILDEKPGVVSGSENLGTIINKINQLRIPLVAPFKYEEIPLSEAFPLEESVKEFGIPYFTNTIAYMIAYALLQKPEEIELFGVNQAGSHEYTEERGGVEYWLGVANGRGVKITINGKDSQLMKYKGRYGNNILYGYLQNYQDFISSKKKFGDQVIRKLLKPQPIVNRVVRKVN